MVAHSGRFDNPIGDNRGRGRGDHGTNNYRCGRRASRGGRGTKLCTHCGQNNHTIDFCRILHGKPASANNAIADGNYLTGTSDEQVVMTKSEYDSILQQTNAASSSTANLVASGNTCLHSSSTLPWVIDPGASDHMTGNPSIISNLSRISSSSFATVANGTKTHVQSIGTVSTLNLTLSNVLYLHQFPFNLLSVHKLTHSLN